MPSRGASPRDASSPQAPRSAAPKGRKAAPKSRRDEERNAALDVYWNKRDFGRTPEPARQKGKANLATEASGEGRRRFVVQRHRARRLHYDFRLEMDGVLVSWAVPKGPTLDPAARQLAVHVEDHPIEYMDFEGVIPAGEYGGGDVIVWDRGYWEPYGTDDPVAAVAAGELHVDVYGEKLAGRFVLIRRGKHGSGKDGSGKDGSGKEQWLLFHKRDEYAVAGWDPEAFPRSVPSGRTNDEVAAGADAVWLSNAPAGEAEVDLKEASEEDLPDFVPPMLAGRRKAPAADDDWFYELRWEGRRAEARVAVGGSGATVTLLGQDGQPLTEMFPELTRSASWLSARRALVDGVVVALDEGGRPTAEAMARRMAAGDGSGSRPPVAYQVFDLLHLDARSWRFRSRAESAC